jgi:SOS response regulatory protein OraA/RecX
MMQMIPYMNDRALAGSLIKQVREELRKRGYGEKAIEEILRWYE